MEADTSDARAEILIVEDSRVEAELLRRMLDKAGYRVRQARDGKEGLQALRERPCALVISDIQMPVMDGYELCREIKHDETLWSIPVILASVLSEPEDIIKALNVGADSYLTKPCVEASLLVRVRSLLAIPASRPDERCAEQVAYDGKLHTITAGRRQMVNLLLSVYENTLFQNRELISVQAQLNRLNNFLEDQVQRRTAALAQSEARYRRITEGLTDYQYTVQVENGRAVKVMQSPACVTVTGYTADEFVSNPNLWIEMVAPGEREMVAEHVRQILAGKEVAPLEHHIIRKDGELRWVVDTTILFKDATGKLLSYDGVIKDITERKHAEIALNHANRALATVSAVNRKLVYATDEDELLQSICQAIVEQRGYRMAWVGYVQHDADKSVSVAARAGYDEGYLDGMHITWAENERGMGPTGRAARSGTTQVCQDIAGDPFTLPWRAAAQQRGYAASIALPLADDDGQVFGVLSVYAEEMNAFSRDEIELLEEMAGDLAFGVRTLHIRHERDQAMEQNQRYFKQLRGSLEETVRAIAGMVELRDPYTAGHQSRVGNLAAAIAAEIGLDGERVQAVHFAGTMHDLGKIKIPAEILSKPGQLSEVEYRLIKTHAQAGYDILRDIKFPWPVAQMVLQHHERLDGSGYPNGLKGDDIMFEARILSVADVVEAMTSHRPYRAGLGIAAALEEILRQRGTCFDPQAVDACLGLFRDKGYSFHA